MATVDYPGAINFPAHPTNWFQLSNAPRGWVLHTPEEPADQYAGTPRWFATYHPDPNQRGSTHYFVSFTGDVYQCVPEGSYAIANGVIGKPYPKWADPAVSLNRQSLSVEIEGYAHSIHQTLTPGSVQWHALVALLKHRARAYSIPLDRAHVIGHYEVANNRSDPGARFPWDALMQSLGEIPPPIPEPPKEDCMRLFWCVEEVKLYLVGGFGCVWVAKQDEADSLRKQLGPESAVHVETINAIKVAAAQ
jgi:hypothetical protein